MNNFSNRTLAALVLSLAVASCSSPGGSSAPAANAGPGRGGRGAGGAVPVVTARAQRKAMPLTIPAVGTVESIVTVQIRSQVTGQLSQIHFDEGQEVKKGDRLFTLDQRPFRVAIQQAEAVLARDTATYKNAQAQATRSQNLVDRGVIPREQYDTAQATVAALAATVEADKAAVETARVNLQYTEINAPVDGRTGVLNVHAGDLIRASDSAMVVINQLSPIYVSFAVPGRLLTDVRRFQAKGALDLTAVTPSGMSSLAPAQSAPPAGAPASGTAGASAAEPPAAPAEHGTLAFIDNSVDPTTGTIRLKGSFPNEDRQLWPGAFVQVTLHLATEANAVVVPAVAVQTSQDGQYVYVVKPDRTVEMRPVKVQRQQGDEMVIAQGVSVGDVVVTDGHLRLTPGATVSERGDDGPRGGQRSAGAGGGDRARGGQPSEGGGRQGR
jgi:membrane fusion protein, multidrug efflux system